MMDDLQAKIAQIEALRPTIGDVAADAAIAALRQQQTTAPSPRQAQVDNQATVGVLNQGDVAGNITTTIYIHGQRTQSNEQLLAAYLNRLTNRCIGVSLQGVREQRADSDVLTLSLDRVYTQLATTAITERETSTGEEVALA